ncbi:flagellar hook-associated protein FlgK [Candidatus Latescibacterota bacterium]
MGNLFYGININRNTLKAQTDVLNTTAHNIANANTPGFSRQTVNLASIDDSSSSGLRMSSFIKVGSGVESTMVTRSRFELYDGIFRKVNQGLNFDQKTEELMHQVELLFDEPSDRSLGGIINDFFNGWLDISNAPQDIAARQSLHSVASEMTDRFKRIYNSLVGLREDINAEIVAIPSQINEIVREITDLNGAIFKSESQGGPANDLRDKLDLLVDELSDFASVRTVKQENGSTTVLIGNKVMAEREAFTELSTRTEVLDDGFIRTTIVSADGLGFEPNDGKLGGLINFRDNVITVLLNDLDKLAEGIVTNINFEHRNGYGLDGLNDRDFFDPNKKYAFNFELSSDIDDVSHIGASINGARGDNANAFNINELKDKRIIDDRYSINEFYNGFIANLGVIAREAKSSRINGELLVSQMDNSRESIKGVSVDEELITMIQAQHIYQSASRLIQVLDQLIEEVLNIV